MILDPNTLDNFNRNTLPQEMLIKIESEMLQNKVANASFSTLMQEYLTRPDIDDLIGEDEENDNLWKENKKNIDDICKNKQVCVSVEINNIIQQRMNNMKVTKEEMVKVAERRKAISSDYKSNLTLVENLVAVYKTARPELSEEEVTETVDKLMKGCEELTLKYNRAIAEGFNAEEEIISLTKDMDVETRFNYLVNALSAVEALNANNFASLKKANETMKQSIEDYTKATDNPTEADCDDMQKLLIEAIANNALLLNGTENAQQLLASAKDANTVIDFTSAQYDDARTKAEMALAMWLEYEDGNLTSIESGATPESIGIGAATAVEEAKIINDVATGRKTADIAIKCLKILGGVALFLLLGYIGVVIAAAVGGLAATALLSIFGTSTTACIATIAICLPLLSGFAQLCVDGGSFVFEQAGKAFDFVVEKLRESVFPKIKETFTKVINWFKEKLGGHQTSVDTAVVMA